MRSKRGMDKDVTVEHSRKKAVADDNFMVVVVAVVDQIRSDVMRCDALQELELAGRKSKI